MEKLNKRDLIEMVAEKAHLSKKDAKDAIETAFDLIEQSLLRGEEVNITNFGVFTPKTRAQRTGTNPKSHELIEIEKAHTVAFRLSKSLKEKLNR